LSTPRCAIAAVISWKASRPSLVKLKVTTGWRVSSKFCSGLRMSVPESAGLSWITQKRSGGGASAFAGASRTTRMPSGTSMTSAFARSSSSRSWSADSRESDGAPLLSACPVSLLNA
jgi:hypothetical protein